MHYPQATQKLLAQERISRHHKERESEATVAVIQRKEQEIDLLKAMLGKLQKYSHSIDSNGIQGGRRICGRLRLMF